MTSEELKKHEHLEKSKLISFVVVVRKEMDEGPTCLSIDNCKLQSYQDDQQKEQVGSKARILNFSLQSGKKMLMIREKF